jgi:hypothetical protein
LTACLQLLLPLLPLLQQAITAEMCFWLIRLLAGNSRTLLEWPEFRAALAASPVAVRRARGGSANAATLRNWTATLTTRAKVEVSADADACQCLPCIHCCTEQTLSGFDIE